MKKFILILAGVLLFGTPVFASSFGYMLYSNAVEEINIIPKNSLFQAKKSISDTGYLKVAYIGDSITEGGDIFDNNDKYSARLRKLLTESLRPAADVEFLNFGLGARTISLAANPNYLATVTDPQDPNLGFSRTWSTPGKSWRDHIRDYQPDLLVIAFGMNDSFSTTGADEAFITNLDGIIQYSKTWTKKPSIVIVPTILPTKDITRTPQRQDITQSVARSAREYGKENGIIVADANRLFNISLNGKDDVSRANTTEFNFNYFPTSWDGDTSSFSLANNTLTPTSGATNKFTSRINHNFYNGFVQVDVKNEIDGTPGVAWINYRSSDIGRFTVQVRSGATGSIQLYHGSTLLATTSNLNIPTGSFNKIRIEAYGIHHEIYLNGVSVITWQGYKGLTDGFVGFGSDQTVPTYANLQIGYHDPITTDPLITEDEFFGRYNDSLQDGNGINHPTGLGHSLVYLPAFYGIIKNLSDY